MNNTKIQRNENPLNIRSALALSTISAISGSYFERERERVPVDVVSMVALDDDTSTGGIVVTTATSATLVYRYFGVGFVSLRSISQRLRQQDFQVSYRYARNWHPWCWLACRK